MSEINPPKRDNDFVSLVPINFETKRNDNPIKIGVHIASESIKLLII